MAADVTWRTTCGGYHINGRAYDHDSESKINETREQYNDDDDMR